MVVPLNTTKILLILLIYSVAIGFYVVQKNEADSGSFFQPIPMDIPIGIQSKNDDYSVAEKNNISSEIIPQQNVWKHSEFGEECSKETEGWPPEKLGPDLRPYLRPETNTTLIMPILRPNTTALDEWGKARAKTHIVVVCTSAVDAFERRASVRKTWKTFSDDLPITVIFLVGVQSEKAPEDQVQARVEEEAREYGDLLQEDFVDTYENLTLKSMFMLKFTRTYLTDITDWILKVDDDCYVDVRVLLHYTRSLRPKTSHNHLIGKVLGSSPVNRPNCSDTDHVFAYKWSVPKYMFRDDTFPNALSGSGYLMSQTVTSCLYNKGLDTSFLVLEDIFITGVVREKCGLQLKHSPRFQYMGQHLCKLAKKFDLLIHYVKTEKHMEAFHNMLTGKATCETTNENTLRYKVLSEDEKP